MSPDWVIFEVFGDKLSPKSSQNVQWIFGLKLKTSLLGKNCCSYILANFWKHLGYFLFQHLVTVEINYFCVATSSTKTIKLYFASTNDLWVFDGANANLFLFYSNNIYSKNCHHQWYSNMDRWRRRQAHWQLDYPQGPDIFCLHLWQISIKSKRSATEQYKVHMIYYMIEYYIVLHYIILCYIIIYHIML